MKGRGQNFSDFMKEEGLYEEAQELATKKILAAQFQAEMKKQHYFVLLKKNLYICDELLKKLARTRKIHRQT